MKQTLMPEYFEPPEPSSRKPETLEPAIVLARANPLRWVYVTEHKTATSAASYSSKMRRPMSIVRRSGIEVRRDGAKIYLRYDEANDEFLQLNRPADAPDVDDPAFAVPPEAVPEDFDGELPEPVTEPEPERVPLPADWNPFA